MAVFPAGNPGVAPLDPTTPVGQFRIVYGDIVSVPYSPVEPGYGNYTELSDAEITGFIEQGGGSINRGIGYLYLAMAGRAAKESLSVADYDLKIDLTKQAGDLRATAAIWFGLGDDEDIISGEEAFEIVPTGTAGGPFIPEGTIPVWGRQYSIGRWS